MEWYKKSKIPTVWYILVCMTWNKRPYTTSPDHSHLLKKQTKKQLPPDHRNFRKIDAEQLFFLLLNPNDSFTDFIKNSILYWANANIRETPIEWCARSVHLVRFLTAKQEVSGSITEPVRRELNFVRGRFSTKPSVDRDVKPKLFPKMLSRGA